MSIKELKARLREINIEAKAAEKSNDTEALDKLLAEAEDINAKLENSNKLARLNQIANLNDDDEGENGKGNEPENKAEKRGKALRAGKTVKMSMTLISPKAAVPSSETVMPKHTATDIKETFNDVSSLVDLVKVVPLDGGESYERGFEKTYGEGDYTAEGEDYHEDDPKLGKSPIRKVKITHYVEEPEEIKKLAPAAYDNTIRNSTSRGVRKKISRQIVIGTDTANSIVGIFNAPETIIEKSKDLEISKIDNTTLDEIVYGFGGDEDVEGYCGLILSKPDLKAFAMLRNGDGTKVYEVKTNGNCGTIDGVPYIINSACPPLSRVTTEEGKFCMAYGPYNNYELAVFGDIDVQESKDYKFRSGQIACRADAYVGGNTVAWNGFLRVKKASSE